MNMHLKKVVLLASACVLSVSSAYASEGTYDPIAKHPTQVYFGDPHLHTSLSMDAGAWGNNLGLEPAYRFARGAEITSSSGIQAKLSRPLDWVVIADHSDGYGFFPRLLAQDPFIMEQPEGRRWYEQSAKGGNEGQRAAADDMIKMFSQGQFPYKVNSPEMLTPVWEDVIAAAEQFNEPDVFTAFIAYEWTSFYKGNNLHRVVIFRDNADKTKQTIPYTMTDSPDPENLWKALEVYEQKTGGRVMASPHNGNLSNGEMFAEVTLMDRKPLDQAYVTTRKRWERIYEATQIKGDGEAHPFLSPDDEFADYETWDLGNLDSSFAKTNDMLDNEYARSALKLGLNYQEKFGVNPFQFGLTGAGDSHTSLSAMEENSFMGKHTGSEPNAERWETPFRASPIGRIEGWQEVASGYTGVWATGNTRTELWDAMHRRETYGTTGPRMTVRMFGGWEFKSGDDTRSDYVDLGYDKGVPMGGELHTAEAGKTPGFIVTALSDPMGANLDRVQMVKGWRDHQGKLHEKVYDIAWSDKRKPDSKTGKLPPVGNTVNVPEATWTNTIGDSQLTTVWQDPDFDSKQHAFYYVRVLEIPTPRWTAYDAKRFNITMGKEVPMTTQERAYTSPIWYIP